MSGTDTETRRAWITRILGVQFAPGGASDLPGAIAAWQSALEAVGAQITALQRVLRPEPDPDLQDIAEFGLGAMTGSHKVKLQAALLEMAPGPKAAAALKLVDVFRAHIAADPRIAACDANPFQVPMSIRRTLTPALDALHTALAGGTKP
jgi:hypothetical protein